MNNHRTIKNHTRVAVLLIVLLIAFIFMNKQKDFAPEMTPEQIEIISAEPRQLTNNEKKEINEIISAPPRVLTEEEKAEIEAIINPR